MQMSKNVDNDISMNPPTVYAERFGNYITHYISTDSTKQPKAQTLEQHSKNAATLPLTSA